ncbi:hypothetical protein [Stenotrophomonas sp. PSU-St83]
MHAASLLHVCFAVGLAVAGCAGCIHQFLQGQPVLALGIALASLMTMGTALATRHLAVPVAMALACTLIGAAATH